MQVCPKKIQLAAREDGSKNYTLLRYLPNCKDDQTEGSSAFAFTCYSQACSLLLFVNQKVCVAHQETPEGTDAVLGDPLDGCTGCHCSRGAHRAHVEGMDEAAGGQGFAHPPSDMCWQASHLVLQVVRSHTGGEPPWKHKSWKGTTAIRVVSHKLREQTRLFLLWQFGASFTRKTSREDTREQYLQPAM